VHELLNSFHDGLTQKALEKSPGGRGGSTCTRDGAPGGKRGGDTELTLPPEVEPDKDGWVKAPCLISGWDGHVMTPAQLREKYRAEVKKLGDDADKRCILHQSARGCPVNAPDYEKKGEISTEFEKIVQPLSLDNMERRTSPLHLTRSKFELTENMLAESRHEKNDSNGASQGRPSPQELLREDILSISSSPEFSRKAFRQRPAGQADQSPSASSHQADVSQTNSP